MVEPLPYQQDAIPHHIAVIQRHGASLEASVAGFGKTYVAAFVAREMQHRLVVCCPKVTVPQWQDVCAAVGVPWRSISNYEDHKPPPRRRGAKITEHHRIGHTDMGRWEVWGRRWRWTFPRPTLLVLDEADTCKDRHSHNSKLMVAARRQGIPTLAMSATIGQDPTDFFAAGYLLGLHAGTTEDFLAWSMRFGVRRGPFDWEFDPQADPTALDRLNAELFPAHGHRKSYDQIPGFPEERTDVLSVPSNPEALTRIAGAWAKVEELEALADEAPSAVVARLRARQLAELAKVPGLIDLARQHVAAGAKVPIFVNFTATIDALAEKLRWPIIDGRHDDEDYRRDVVARFQADGLPGLLIQIRAGGVGISLHDTHGHFPRHSLISPPDGARNLIQALGRNRRTGGKTPAFRTIVTLAGSVEARVHARVAAKAQQIETINDGDLDPLFP
jgi:superfamily II DNA or RNA helicase